MENLIFFWQEYRHYFAIGACIWFHFNCKKNGRILTTPTDYYVWGMLTIGIGAYFKGLPVG